MAARISLVQVRLNRQGYDSSGQYYGIGMPLFRATSSLNGNVLEFRARDRAAAKAKLNAALAHVGLGLDKDFNFYDVRRFKEG